MSPLQFCKMDESLRGPLIARMKEILRETESHNAAHFNERNWDWQYKNIPGGGSEIFLVLQNEKIQGYYHVPYYSGKVFGEPAKFAMIQDVAVSADMRGQGVFRQLAEFANDEINKSANLAYTFPNDRSIHTFLKYNRYHKLKTLDALLLPLHTRKVIQSKKKLLGFEYLAGIMGDTFVSLKRVKKPTGFSIEKVEGITPGFADVFEKFSRSIQIGIDRSMEYLRWRFEQKPGTPHHFLLAKENGKPVAAVVFKLDEVMRNNAIILMDFACIPGKEEFLPALLQELKRSPEKFMDGNPTLIFAAGNSPVMKSFSKIGFLKIPQSLNPRPLNLLVRNIDVPDEKRMLMEENWHITLADWDVL